MLDAAKALWEILAKMRWVRIMFNNWFLLAPFSLILTLFAFVIAQADAIHHKLQQIIAYLDSATWVGMYAKINVIVPLTETLGMLGLCLGLKITVLVVRWVKALIPNVVTGS